MRVEHAHLALGVAAVDVIAALVERRDHVRLGRVVQRQLPVRAVGKDEQRRMLEQADEEDRVVARMVLHFEEGRRKAILLRFEIREKQNRRASDWKT